MSFVWFADKPLRSREQVAREVYQVALNRRLDKLATVMTLMGIAVEVGTVDENGDRQWWCPANRSWPKSLQFPHDSISNDGRSCGYLQQQVGPDGQLWWGTTESEMTLSKASNSFLARLTDDWKRAADSPDLAGQFVYQVQQCDPDYAYRYAEHWDEAWDVLNRALSGEDKQGSEVTVPQPDFNEYPVPSPGNSLRFVTPVDLFILHTEEGSSNADELARYNQRVALTDEWSYHYTISEDYEDHGVTVCDLVDIDRAAWSVGDANARSINLVFAGSTAYWTREEWMRQSNAIDVAAFIAVRDCGWAGIPPDVIGRNYRDPPGITEHRYVTEYLGWGTHWDVGDGFPWDYFAERVNRWAEGPPEEEGEEGKPSVSLPESLSTRELLEDVWVQLRGPDGLGWPQLGTNDNGQNLTLVDAIADLKGTL